MIGGKKVVGVLGVGLVGAVVWQLATRKQREQPRPPTAALNQVWIERMPRDTRDMVRQFVAFKTPRRQLGLAEASSHWRVLADRFTWHLQGNVLEASFPQAGRMIEFEIKTWPCKDTAPAPFELCLELRFGGQTLSMFSRETWRIDPDGRMPTDVPVPSSGFAHGHLDTPMPSQALLRSSTAPDAWRLHAGD